MSDLSWLNPTPMESLCTLRGCGGKTLMGVVLVAIGVLILSGLDKRVEAILVEASPAWLTELTTRF